MSRARPLAAVLAAASLLLLTACSKPVTPPASASAPAPDGAGAQVVAMPEPVTVRIMTLPGFTSIGGYGDTYVDAVIAAFYQVNTRIRIEKVPWEPGPFNPEVQDPVSTWLAPKLAAGQIDLFPGSYVDPELRRTNALPLNPYLKTSGLDLKPFGPLLDAERIDGQLYQMPVNAQVQVMKYNPKLFAEAGLPEPALGWTWDDYRRAAIALTIGDDTYKQQWGGYEPWGPGSLANVMVNQRFGSGPLTPEGVREVMAYWADLVQQAKAVIPRPPQNANGSFNPTSDQFALGRGAMTSGFVQAVQAGSFDPRAKFKVGIAPLPVAPGSTPALAVYAEGYSVARTSPNADAAWEFLRFMAGPEGAEVMARDGWIPAYRSDAARQAWFEQVPAPPRSSEALFTLPYLQMSLSLDEAERKVRKAFSEALGGVLEGKLSAEAAYQQFMASK